MLRFLINLHFSLLLIFILNMLLGSILQMEIIGEIQVFINVTWFISGIILVFFKHSTWVKYYFWIFPTSLAIGIILFISNKFAFALYTFIIIRSLIPGSSIFQDKSYTIKTGNNFISPTYNYDLFVRHTFLENSVTTIRLNQNERITKFLAEDKNDFVEIMLELNNGVDTIITINK